MNFPPKADILRRLDSSLHMFKVTCSEYPDMRVNIKQGSFWDNGTNFVEFPGGSTRPLMPPNFGAQIALVGVSVTGKIAVIYGEPGCENIMPPVCPKTVMPCAMILLRNTSTCITQEMIFDCRPVFYTRYPVDHKDLSGRNEPDAHKIGSITGLIEALESRPNLEQLKLMLDAKADTTGTNSPVFVLNNAGSGVPTFDAMLVFQRGDIPNSILKFSSEPGGGILFSDDNGTTWTSITDIYTKENIDALLENKADKIHNHTTLETQVTKMIYVDQSRDDEYIASGNITKPFHTIAEAINIADPGDIINLMPGTYKENIEIPDGVSLISPAVAKAFVEGNVFFPYSDIPVTISNVVFKDGEINIDARAEMQSCFFYSPVKFLGSSKINATDCSFVVQSNDPAVMANGQELNMTRAKVYNKGAGSCITSKSMLRLSMSYMNNNSFNCPSIAITGGTYKMNDSGICNRSDGGKSVEVNGTVSGRNSLKDMEIYGDLRLGDAITVIDGCDMAEGSISGSSIVLRTSAQIAYKDTDVETELNRINKIIDDGEEGSLSVDVKRLKYLTSKMDLVDVV